MKALVAEDFNEVRSMLTKLLSENGFKVEEAHDGREALTILESSIEPFSLLLTDFNMPHMTGLQLIEAALERKIPIKKIVVFSGMMGNEQLLVEI